MALDCRWLGIGGAGTVTEHLLASIRSAPSPRPIDWRFWDPGRQGRSRASHHDIHPTRAFGQASLLRQPHSDDLVCFMHQIRPLLAPRNVTVIHDTTPLRYASRRVAAVKREFFRRIARSSALVITVSEWSRERIVEDLGVKPEHVTVIPNIIGTTLSERIRRQRELTGPQNYMFYLGGLNPHKNVERLLQAFVRTDFHSRGGRLVVAGCDEPAMTRLSGSLTMSHRESVTFLGRCPQSDIDRLYAGAQLVVQPSLEEGFGLPAREALSAGIPVVGSTAGALAEVSSQFIASFDPLATDEMVAAIDSGAAHSERFDIAEERARAAHFIRTAPDLAEYAPMFESAFLRALD